jgi:uncharacterized protein YycO
LLKNGGEWRKPLFFILILFLVSIFGFFKLINSCRRDSRHYCPCLCSRKMWRAPEPKTGDDVDSAKISRIQVRDAAPQSDDDVAANRCIF